MLLSRFHKFLLYLGYSSQASREAKVGLFCKTLSEFALEYRTTREKLVQQREKKATQRERRRTRGKMIVEVRLTVFIVITRRVLWMISCNVCRWLSQRERRRTRGKMIVEVRLTIIIIITRRVLWMISCNVCRWLSQRERRRTRGKMIVEVCLHSTAASNRLHRHYMTCIVDDFM